MYVPISEIGKTTASCCPTPQIGVTPQGAVLVSQLASPDVKSWDNIDIEYDEDSTPELPMPSSVVYSKGGNVVDSYTFEYDEDGQLTNIQRA